MNIFQKIKREMKWIGFAIFFKRKVNELDKDRSVTLADELEKQVTKTPKFKKDIKEAMSSHF